MTYLEISDLNRGWGICGFTSAIGALHQNGLLGDSIKQAISKDQLNTRILAEIKSYFVLLQSQKHQVLIDEIEAFTKTFKGYKDFSLQSYINGVNGIAINAPKRRDKQFSVAMPPSAVTDYLRQMGGMKLVQLIDNPNTKFNNVILGFGDKTANNRARWKGLGHWVYMNNNILYNWGEKQTLPQLLKIKPNWHIVYQILLRK